MSKSQLFDNFISLRSNCKRMVGFQRCLIIRSLLNFFEIGLMLISLLLISVFFFPANFVFPLSCYSNYILPFIDDFSQNHIIQLIGSYHRYDNDRDVTTEFALISYYVCLMN
jgi:hypothetical protein